MKIQVSNQSKYDPKRAIEWINLLDRSISFKLTER